MYIANKEVLESSKVKPFGMQDKVGYMLGDVGQLQLVLLWQYQEYGML